MERMVKDKPNKFVTFVSGQNKIITKPTKTILKDLEGSGNL